LSEQKVNAHSVRLSAPNPRARIIGHIVNTALPAAATSSSLSIARILRKVWVGGRAGKRHRRRSVPFAVRFPETRIFSLLIRIFFPARAEYFPCSVERKSGTNLLRKRAE
jgi:hypothetical protein